jgi:ketosteroid isomerase-like protein
MSDQRRELARESVEAWGQRDAEWFVDNTTPDFEFVPAILTTVEGEGGAVRGAEGIRQFFAGLDEPWGSFVIDEAEFREVGEQVVCTVRLRAKGRGSGLELDQPVAMTLWFRGDKIARAESFLDGDQALEAASKDLEEAQ